MINRGVLECTFVACFLPSRDRETSLSNSYQMQSVMAMRWMSTTNSSQSWWTKGCLPRSCWTNSYVHVLIKWVMPTLPAYSMINRIHQHVNVWQLYHSVMRSIPRHGACKCMATLPFSDEVYFEAWYTNPHTISALAIYSDTEKK